MPVNATVAFVVASYTLSVAVKPIRVNALGVMLAVVLATLLLKR